MSTYDRKMLAYNDLVDALNDAALGRQQRPELVDGEQGWVVYERAVMLARTNHWRGAFSLPPVEVQAVEWVERQAAGHSDYTRKYALGCAEIAVGERDETGRPMARAEMETNDA